MHSAREFNFDGLVGPSHNYAGLSFGNLASQSNLNQASNPRQAALQGLEKMRALAHRGFAQALLPPQPRPDFRFLRSIGFGGSDADVLARAGQEAPAMLACAWSASPMWAANAATVSPSFDSLDGRTHFTVANLNNRLHRSLEHAHTGRALRAIFNNQHYFAVHDALPSTPALGDEGAANHSRLCRMHGAPGVELFVHGRTELNQSAGLTAPQRYPARQSLEASQAVARLHGLAPAATIHALQNPAVIDQGVFHNDVISVGNGNVLLYHEQAFADEAATLAQLGGALRARGAELMALRVGTEQVALLDAVRSYLFNSQLLTKDDGQMVLLLAQECAENGAVVSYLETLLAGASPIDELMYFDLRQSMRNGGGPACLRLRVVLSEAAAGAMQQGVIMHARLHQRLCAWVHKHYRDRLEARDLQDPALALESSTALEELGHIVNLPGLYQSDW